jgi:hypothetical protein
MWDPNDDQVLKEREFVKVDSETSFLKMVRTGDKICRFVLKKIQKGGDKIVNKERPKVKKNY